MHLPSARPVDRSSSGPTVTVDPEPADSGPLDGNLSVTRTSSAYESTVQAPPEILRFRSRGVSGDYYQALSTAAAMRLRLLGTLHARGELAGPAAREATRRRLAAQQRQAWQQLQWLVAEMRRLDEDDRGQL
jgi:hypothetical protein